MENCSQWEEHVQAYLDFYEKHGVLQSFKKEKGPSQRQMLSLLEGNSIERGNVVYQNIHGGRAGLERTFETIFASATPKER